jgi:hypothetical protein
MITEPNNPIIRTIKQILEIYYPTIYKVALASDLSKKFGQTEAFLKDLVQLLVRRKEEEVSVDKLVKLLDQHKQSYWSFLNDVGTQNTKILLLKKPFNKKNKPRLD